MSMGGGGLTFNSESVHQIAFRVNVAHELAQRYLLVAVDGDSFPLFDNHRRLVFEVLKPKRERGQVFNVANDVW